MIPLRVYGYLALLGFLALIIWAGMQPPRPAAQTPKEYGFSTEPAIVDCARTYGVRQDTTDPETRKVLTTCVEAVRKAHSLGYR
jgi:hypothetical protein